nr:putative reverse transcriptase domain-containing protein [Tanacetum cinerariifolium]
MDINDEEDENELEWMFPYEEVDPLNPPPPSFDSKPEDVIEVEDTVEHEDETVPASVHELGESSTTTFLLADCNRLLPSLMRRDIDSLFGQIASFLRRLCGHEMAHALVKKKGKAKDEYYGKLIVDLGNEVRSSVEEGTPAMENLVTKLGNAEESAKWELCLKKDRMRLSMFRLKMRRVHLLSHGDPLVTLSSLVSLVVSLLSCCSLGRWFEKIEITFRINECAKDKKVKFVADILRGPALTWWDSKVAILGLDVANYMGWIEMRKLMTTKFCPAEELQRMENEL